MRGRYVRGARRIAAPVALDMPADLEIRASHLRIIDAVDRQLVATIEVLSPINKVQGSGGRREFLRKREQILQSGTHWLEIDLLRAGSRSLGIPTQGAYASGIDYAEDPPPPSLTAADADWIRERVAIWQQEAPG